MGLNILTLGSGKTYTNMVALGISNMRTSGSTVYFTVAATGEEVSVTLPTPADGISVTGVSDKGNGKFTLLFSDGSESDPIQTVKGQKGDKGDKLTFNDLTDAEKESLKGSDGEKGQDGFSPIAKVEKVGKVATITITDKNGTTTATVSDGSGSEGGEANVIDSISVNGVNVEPDENKNVDITVPSTEGLATETWVNEQGFLTEHQDISNLVEKEDGKGLSSNDYTTEEKEKLASLENYDDTTLSSRIKTVEDEVPNLATKTYVGEQIAAADHLKREIVTVIPSDEEAKDNIIYMLKVESAVGNDKYQEYMKIDGTVQLVGDTSVDLTDYIKTSEVNTKLEDYAKTEDVNTFIEILQTDKADANDLTAHTDDLDIHVTIDDKITWNTVADKIDKTSIATTLSSESTNDEVVGAKLAYDELQKAELATKEQFGTASGEVISVNDSVDGKIRDLKLYGKSFQQSYTGKNLLNPTLTTTTTNGITCTQNVGLDGKPDGTYTLNGTATAFTQFSLAKKLISDNIKICGCPSGGSTDLFYIVAPLYKNDTWTSDIKDVGNGVTVKDVDYDYYNINIAIASGATVNNVVFKPMLVDASLYPEVTYDDFEAYCGGIAAPNPSYPQEINSVGDDGSLVVTSCGKNVIPFPYYNGSDTRGGITATVNSNDGSINLAGTATNNYFFVLLHRNYNGKGFARQFRGKTITISGGTASPVLSLAIYDKNGNNITPPNNEMLYDFGGTITIAVPENACDMYSYYYCSSGAVLNTILKPQLEVGEVATEYEPYKGSTTTIPLSEPLRAIGDVKDEITYQDGKLGVLRRFKKYTFDGSDDESWLLGSTNNFNDVSFTAYIDGLEPVTYKDSWICVPSLCDRFSKKDFLYQNTITDECYMVTSTANANRFSIRLLKSRVSEIAVDAVKVWLASNPITVWYELKTPVFEPFADQTLPYLSTYDGVTNIFNDDALSAEMTVKYPTNDVSGVGSRNESRIADLTKDTDEKFDDVNFRATELKVFGWNVPRKCPIQNYIDSDGVFHQRVGRVEISNIVANESMFGTNFRLVPPTDCKKESYLNGYCKLYQTAGSADYDGWNTYRDNKSIGFLSTYEFIIVKDDTYADEAAFKKAMKGVYLYYELAEEITMSTDGNEIIGDTDISAIGNGTVTGAISAVNDSLTDIGNATQIYSHSISEAGSKDVDLTQYKFITIILYDSFGKRDVRTIPTSLITDEVTIFCLNFTIYAISDSKIYSVSTNVSISKSSISNSVGLAYNYTLSNFSVDVYGIK